MSPKYERLPAPASTATNPSAYWLWTAAVGSIALAAFDLIEPLANLSLRVPRNFNEGWNAYWAISAVSGGQLYPSVDAAVSNNYPPASFFIVGLLGQLTGDPILAGRAVALASFLVVAINIVIWLRRSHVRGSLAVLSGASFIITLDALSHGSIGADDPQWLAHALATTGMVILWQNPRSTSRLAGAAALMMLGGWVKHLVIPLPAAILAWLWYSHRRGLWKWLIVAGALGGLLLAATLNRYGEEFLAGVLLAPRRFLPGRSILMAYSAAAALFPILCVASLSLRRFRTAPAARFAVLYLAISAITAVITSAGDGVAENAFFDMAIAAALAAGLALEDITRQAVAKHVPRFDSAAVLVSAVILIVWTPLAVHSNIERLRTLSIRVQETPSDIEFVRQHSARAAACENLSLCFWSGASFNLDFFNLGQKLKTGRIPLAICNRLFDGTRYSVLQLYSAPTDIDTRLPAACNRVIADHYDVVRKSINGVFLTARKRPSSA
jgi:hypothetical protein